VHGRPTRIDSHARSFPSGQLGGRSGARRHLRIGERHHHMEFSAHRSPFRKLTLLKSSKLSSSPLHFQARISIFHYNRGTWEPTVFNVVTRDVCSTIFDKNTYWYTSWFQNLLNADEIKEKCLITKDVSMVISKPLLFS